MKLNDITEAPINNIQTHDYAPDGIDPQDTTWPDNRDWALISKPNLQRNIKNAFKKSPYEIDVYAYKIAKNKPDLYDVATKYQLIGAIQADSQLETLQKLLKNDLPEARPGVITVIMLEHGSGLHTLTPWILAHRIAHGLAGFHETELQDFMKSVGISYDMSGKNNPMLQMFQMQSVKFKDKSRGRIRSFLDGELPVEITTEIILTGNLRVKPIEGIVTPEQAEDLRKVLVDYVNSMFRVAEGGYWVSA